MCNSKSHCFASGPNRNIVECSALGDSLLASISLVHAAHTYSYKAASQIKFVMYVTRSIICFFFCKTGSKVWMFLLLSSLPVILAAPQQMVWWWCLRSGHVAASSALCPLCRPLPRHPMTNYFLFVTETQSSEGRGVFCRRSYQANLTLFPLVGHSWFDWGLVFKAL